MVLWQMAVIANTTIQLVPPDRDIECRKTKTKVITLTNYNTRKQRNEPIRIRSNCM